MTTTKIDSLNLTSDLVAKLAALLALIQHAHILGGQAMVDELAPHLQRMA